MSPAAVTNKDQKSGDQVEFVPSGPSRFEVVAVTQSVQALKGIVRKPALPVTIESMKGAIAAHQSQKPRE